jgi:hypothetical protein
MYIPSSTVDLLSKLVVLGGVQVLTLASCGLNDTTTDVLAAALTSPSSNVKFLDLTDNKICSKGVRALATVVSKLERLVLSGNPIGRQGGGALALASAYISSSSNEGALVFFASPPKKICGGLDSHELINNYCSGEEEAGIVVAGSDSGGFTAVMTDEEQLFYKEMYDRISGEPCPKSPCRWPSCRLLEVTGFIKPGGSTGCEIVSNQLEASGVVRGNENETSQEGDAGGKAFLTYLSTEPVGYLIRALRLKALAASANWGKFQSALDCWGSREAGGAWVNRGSVQLLWPLEQESHYCGDRNFRNYVHHAECSNLTLRSISLSYSWEPARTCPVTKPSISNYSTSLCGMATGDILIVGDSISEEFDLTLLNTLQACTRKVTCPDGSSFLVMKARNDYLDVTGGRRGPFQNYQSPFYQEILVKNPSIKTAIFNRGAHFENDTAYREGLESLFSAVRHDRPDVAVYFRNTPTGHPYCFDPPTKNTGAPLLKPGNDSTVLSLASWKDANPFHWSEFAGQNEIARELAAKYQVGYLDVASALELRPDSHCTKNDCLHYCIPGPIDVMVQMFLWAVHLRHELNGL